eukprot:CAMPEP_0119144960 /NCGR_PEP_ID=MMETSP1310-20130426/36777_1 /TAXON_ID=464262 /ORGANISM="Genus nov. species nov., Strain RCC2339" /LENGTH=49 /DNA_ID=CAMNT_0007136743 /DNA_START=258 /DNA_END=407 /DNA_ORIENTATION=-
MIVRESVRTQHARLSKNDTAVALKIIRTAATCMALVARTTPAALCSSGG